MKHFINVSSFRSQNKEMLKKALYNLFNLKKLSVVAEGMKTSMRRDCDIAKTLDFLVNNFEGMKTSMRRDCDHRPCG